MSVLEIPTAPVFERLLYPARYKGAHGGRGSGKSHFFAELMVEDHIRYPGMRSVCIREVQKDLKESAKLLITDKIRRLGVSHMFDVKVDSIVTPGGGVIIFKGMQEYNVESIKSLEMFRRAWIEEAHTISEASLDMLRPTIRADADADGPDSEIWASWNPTRKTDAIDTFLRQQQRANAIVVEANWADNPWFTRTLEEERLDDLTNSPDTYEHKWNGAYVTVQKGAYFAAQLALAKAQNRITRLAADPLMTVRAVWDIGGTGKKADACSIWICQFVGKEVWVLDYYEAQGQPLATHLHWLRSRGYDGCLCILPHDGSTNDRVYDVSYESEIKRAQFPAIVVPNQGEGAAMARINVARNLFPRIWFNEETTQAGRDALGWYHPKIDKQRGNDLGPDHDWSSHGADAFGLMCVAYEAPKAKRESDERPRVFTVGADDGARWMGS